MTYYGLPHDGMPRIYHSELEMVMKARLEMAQKMAARSDNPHLTLKLISLTQDIDVLVKYNVIKDFRE